MVDDFAAEEMAKVMEKAVRPLDKVLEEMHPDYQGCSLVAFALGYDAKGDQYSITLVTNNPSCLPTLLKLALEKTAGTTPVAMEKPSAPTRVIH